MEKPEEIPEAESYMMTKTALTLSSSLSTHERTQPESTLGTQELHVHIHIQSLGIILTEKRKLWVKHVMNLFSVYRKQTWSDITPTWCGQDISVRHKKRFSGPYKKNLTAFVCLRACSVRVSSPLLYRSNNQLNEAETEWMTRVWGNTSVASVTCNSLPVSPTRPPTSPRHKTNTYDSQQEQLHKSDCSSIQITALFLFLDPFSVSVLLVGLPSKHDCFVMQSKLHP